MLIDIDGRCLSETMKVVIVSPHTWCIWSMGMSQRCMSSPRMAFSEEEINTFLPCSLGRVRETCERERGERKRIREES